MLRLSYAEFDAFDDAESVSGAELPYDLRYRPGVLFEYESDALFKYESDDESRV